MSKKSISQGDRRARLLELKPRPRATKLQQSGLFIEPRLSDSDIVRWEGIVNCRLFKS